VTPIVVLGYWLMKRILVLGSLVFVIGLFFNAPAYSGEREKCASEAANAHTKKASNRLFHACMDDDNLVFKTDRHSCALKAAKAKTWFASNRLFHACMD
jgi:hypothetical protein